MSSNPHDSASTHRPGFHGPRCWILSLILGLALGFVLSAVLPASRPASHAAHAGPVLVVETRPDSSRHVRKADESTSPIPPDLDLSTPEGQQALSALAAQSAPAAPANTGSHSADPAIPIGLCIPFGLLLLSIALMPFINRTFWHHHYPDFALLLGGMMLTYYLAAFGHYGSHAMLHAGIEYYSFIALVGGLYVVSGGILIEARERGRPLTNTLLLGFGCILANLVGTTGASVLLIRPFLRMNQGRLRPLHVVFFIFIVSNCAGSLTPIGDPPLYLGYLKGVPFFWTATHLWPMWLLTCGTLLAMFFIYDSRIARAPDPDPKHPRVFDPQHRTPLVAGWSAVCFLLLIVAGVFIDPLLKKFKGFDGLPIGATFQLLMAIAAFVTTRPSIRHSNQFTFEPVKEVGFLFVGIFITMVPALGFLRANASGLGLESPTQFYFATGILSAFLDNAPTYLSFLQVAFGVLHLPLDAGGIAQFIANSYDILHPAHAPSPATLVHFNGQVLLEAISLGAVFFGALTYIGNGPNFIVKSIVDAAHARGHGLGVRMPSFFGYIAWAVALLLPVLLLNWIVFIR